MGVELGMPNLMAAHTMQLLPGFLQAQHSDLSKSEDRPSRAAEEPPPAPGSAKDLSNRFMWRRTVAIPGLLHIIDNTEVRFHAQMTHWKVFNVQLKAVLRLFAVPHIHRRFLASCVRGRSKDALASPIAMYTKHRWGTLVAALKKLVDIEMALVAVWSPHAFATKVCQPAQPAEDDEDVEAETLDVGTVTSSIRSPMFWCFCELLLGLQDLLETFRAWAESCYCHRHIWSESSMSQRKREQFLQKEFKRQADVQSDKAFPQLGCPCAGRNAPWLAVGWHKSLLREAASTSLSKVLSERSDSHMLSADDMRILTENWSQGVGAMSLYFELKLACWDHPPLSLAGMAHPDSSLAKFHAEKLVRNFDRLSASAISLEHDLTLSFFDPQRGLRKHIDAWIRGDFDNQARPLHLQRALAEMALWPVVERWIEQGHSILKRVGTHKNVSPAYCSLGQRFATVMHEVCPSLVDR